MEEAETIKRPIQAVANKDQSRERDLEANNNPTNSSGNNVSRPNKAFSRRNPGLVRKQPLPFPDTLDEAELETPTYLRQAAD